MNEILESQLSTMKLIASNTEQNKIRMRNVLGGSYIEKDGWSDNLAIALLCYFEGHMDRPANDSIDENGNSEWAAKKTNESLDLIVEQFLKNL